MLLSSVTQILKYLSKYFTNHEYGLQSVLEHRYITMNTQPNQFTLLSSKSNNVPEYNQQIGANLPEFSPEQFKINLDNRIKNREILLATIQNNLVKGTDFLIIKIGGRNSKPFLTKAGAEKVCGMLALQVSYPNLEHYEKMIFKGKEIKDIVIKCELISTTGNVVAEGC